MSTGVHGVLIPSHIICRVVELDGVVPVDAIVAYPQLITVLWWYCILIVSIREPSDEVLLEMRDKSLKCAQSVLT